MTNRLPSRGGGMFRSLWWVAMDLEPHPGVGRWHIDVETLFPLIQINDIRARGRHRDLTVIV